MKLSEEKPVTAEVRRMNLTEQHMDGLVDILSEGIDYLLENGYDLDEDDLMNYLLKL